jgi:hypothetical protein
MNISWPSTWIVVLALLAAGCAAATGGMPPGSTSSVIGPAEVAESEASDALELVQRHRPRWLTARPDRSERLETVILAYLDGSRMGDVTELQYVPIETIERVEYLDAAQAGGLPGARSLHVQGAIVVISRGR